MPVGQPIPGTTEPGELYVDLQSREIWYGVPAGVDPSGSVLLCDLNGILTGITDAVATANMYTNAAVATRAPVVSPTFTGTPVAPTPAPSDNTGAIATTAWVRALVSSMMNSSAGVGPKGILMYSGPISDIGVGVWAGWVLCDGDNGTPDLRDKFVLGAGNKPVGAGNVNSSLVVSTVPGHKHTIAGTVLNATQIPAHKHDVTVTGTGSFSGNTDPAGEHSHTQTGEGGGGLGQTDAVSRSTNNASRAQVSNISVAPNHVHAFSGTVTINSTGETTEVGGTQSHAHDESIEGAHNHTATSAQLREAIPYFALAFIMKL